MCFVSAEQLSGSRPWGAQRGPVRAPGGDGASVWREQAVWNRRLSLDNTRSAVAIGRSIAFLVLGLAALSVARCDSPPLPPRPCSGLTARPLLRAPSRPHRSYPTHNPFPCPLASPWPPSLSWATIRPPPHSLSPSPEIVPWPSLVSIPKTQWKNLHSLHGGIY